MKRMKAGRFAEDKGAWSRIFPVACIYALHWYRAESNYSDSIYAVPDWTIR